MAKKSAPKLVRQVSLRPGRYFNKRTGQYNVLTPKEIREYAAGTASLIKAGYEPPLLLNHSEPESGEGKPKSRRDAKADELRNTVGWLKSMVVGGDGAAEYIYEVTDAETAKKFDDGTFKFTSPELLPSWTDGKGVVHEKITSHLAITNRPKNPDQSPPELVGALQFSLEDWEPVQFASEFPPNKEGDDDDEGETPAANETPENPDIAKMGGGSGQKRKQNLEALVVALEKHGIQLPADTPEVDEEKLIDRLLTAMMTLVKNEEKMATEATKETQQAPGQQGQRPEVVEQRGVMQYSIEDIDTGKCTNKLLGKFIRQEHKALVDRLDELVKAGTITPAAKRKLLAPECLQFSADEGALAKTFTIEDVIDFMEEVVPPHSAWQATPDQIAEQFALEDHPDGDKHYRGEGPVTADEAKKLNDQIAASMPGMFKQPAGTR